MSYRVINPKRASTIFESISNFNQSKLPMVSGLSHGNSSDKYSWLADFLFKSSGSKVTNKHSMYISLFSDREIMYQEYGDVGMLKLVYPHFASAARQKYSKHTYELSTSQYSKISQPYAEFDAIEFLDHSGSFVENYNDHNSEHTLNFNHWLGRIPCMRSVIFTYNMDVFNVPLTGYMKSVWAYDDNIYQKTQGNLIEIEMPSFENTLCGPKGNALKNYFITHNPNDFTRTVGYKLILDEEQLVTTNVVDGVANMECDVVSYKTDRFIPQDPFINTSYSTNGQYAQNILDNMSFFPEVWECGRAIPRKISISGLEDQKIDIETVSGIHLGEADDQSRISYSICKHMMRIDDNGTDNIVLSMPDFRDPLKKMIEGIDIDTERNRRYSAVVTTKPYMVTQPLCGGQIVEFEFVDVNGEKISYEEFGDFLENPEIFLQIKAPYSYIRELDQELNKREYNSDIINTISLFDPDPNDFNMSTSSYYDDFSDLVYRQGVGLDDLVGGMVGVGKRKAFYVDDIFRSGMYSSDTMVVAGMGFVSESIGGGKTRMVYNLYCSNYHPEASYACGESTPIATEYTLLYVGEAFDRITNYELFRPMIKLPGINGYIKIMKRVGGVKLTKSSNGDNLMMYEVEFPFCPGSVLERFALGSSGDFKKIQVLRKSSYINAGSQAASSWTTYDKDGDRYIYSSDECLTNHLITRSIADYAIVEHDGFEYPSHLVMMGGKHNLLSLIHPQENEYKKFGTYQFEMSSSFIDSDFNLSFLMSNKMWKIGNKYSSYVGRENPTYIADIDTTTMKSDFDQTDFNGTPDKKRWISALFSGSADMIGGSSSDIVIERWSNGNWRPESIHSTQIPNLAGKAISGNFFIAAGTIVDEGDGITSFVIGNGDFENLEFGFSDSDMEKMSGKSNMVITKI